MKQSNNHKILPQDIQDGLLFIPDISGFTEFVQSTDVLLGKQITYELLSEVINQNDLQLNIAEVEGDAILFYRYGHAPSPWELIEQYEKMVQAFENKCAALQKKFLLPLNLSLKVIAHYGPMSEYTIGSFTKLYGEVVIEAHRLLKNSVKNDSYLLLTDSLVKIIGAIADDDLLHYGVRSNEFCEVYGSLRNICFTYLDFSDEIALKRVA